MDTEQTQEAKVRIVHELSLGEDHTLFVMSDGSVDILNLSGEPWAYLADNGIRLNSEEAYLLYVALHEQFKQASQAS